MEIALLFAGLLVAVALGGQSTISALVAFAVFQFLATVMWLVTGSMTRS